MESTSGASNNASPGGMLLDLTIRTAWVESGDWSALVTSGRTRPASNHSWSSGWWMRTGERVVGRSTPASVTGSPARELTNVDLPAHVDPPTTTSIGAPVWVRRGTM